MIVQAEVERERLARGPGARRDLRLLPVAGAAWGVALVCVFLPDASGWCAGGCSAAALLTGAAMMLRRLSAASVGGLMIVVLTVGGAVAFTVMSETARRAAVRGWDGRVVEMVGEVASSASVGSDGRLWMDLQVGGIGSPGGVHAASAPVRVGVGPVEGFDLGAVVRVTGESAATDPGERAALVLFASSATVEREASGVFAVAAGLRHAFIDRSTRLPDPGAGLLPGLAVGDTRAVGPELNEAMRTSGLSHLTAVSGDTSTDIGGSTPTVVTVAELECSQFALDAGALHADRT
ncbi:ComEC/Rec2 family competence protein [Microbacterium hydrocarbonoxydans]|uniref:ComEC/Rec2 family competence protein n=1 Tax=Microbacterium hydrocarbonoxydans TaxID=273678 RepID=UPI00203C90BA|nr:ComEC/Rec2 family competence protein [Microbacterium hydrocarbonoxydans]MCM3780659.1 ComEC/Rec2 family competence protein [Microbacterium hydrocarbonoxydans]